MKVLTYNLNSHIGGGKVTAFNYSKNINDIVGSWTAEIAGGDFSAGNSISFYGVLNGGIITKAYKDHSGLWHLEGKDAGVKLMKSTPDISDLPKGNAGTVIKALADYCGISVTVEGGLSGFNVRSVVTGSTCAEAILELAMFSGYVAFIDTSGNLIVSSASEKPNFSNVINEGGSEIDLDGCATHVLVTVNRRQWPEEENAEELNEDKVHYTGEKPDTKPNKVSYSGSFSNGSYSLTMLEPFGVIQEAKTKITEDGVTIETTEEHNYEYEHQTIWRDNQEYVLFAFIDTGYTMKKEVTGEYSGGIKFSEITTEELKRSLSVGNPIGVPSDWKGKIQMVGSETLTRSTIRTGGPILEEGMPDYAPSFDSEITRNFSRENRGKGLLCNETEKTYEIRQVGSIAPVKVSGESETDKLVAYFFGPNEKKSNLAIQTHSTPEWVEVITHRTYYEEYNNDGDCVVSTRSEYSDNGSKWLTDNALSDTGDEELNTYQKAYASFSQQSHGLEVNFGQSVISPAWQFVEVSGRTKTIVGDSSTVNLGDVSEWYNNGQYIYSAICPHLNDTARTCNIYNIDTPYYQDEGENCVKLFRNRTPAWGVCPRAEAALKLAKAQDIAQLTPTIYASASSGSGKIGYKRDIYIDDYIKEDSTVQDIADKIAANILSVKGNKGLCETVTIPYSPGILPNKSVVSVSHDWANLQTTVSYRVSGNVPDCLISQNVSNIAAIVSVRENSRQNIPQYGKVTAITYKKVKISDVYAKIAYATVQIGNNLVSCTTKLNSLSSGDIVLVSFTSGNKLKGEIISRL